MPYGIPYGISYGISYGFLYGISYGIPYGIPESRNSGMPEFRETSTRSEAQSPRRAKRAGGKIGVKH